MTIEYIEGFQPLAKPKQTNGNLWTACGSDTCMFYLLNGDRYQLCDLDVIDYADIKPNLYFNNEWDCHQAAAGYYTLQCERYPYMDEWDKCVRVQVDPTVVAEIESQIMVFE